MDHNFAIFTIKMAVFGQKMFGSKNPLVYKFKAIEKIINEFFTIRMLREKKLFTCSNEIFLYIKTKQKYVVCYIVH